MSRWERTKQGRQTLALIGCIGILLAVLWGIADYRPRPQPSRVIHTITVRPLAAVAPEPVIPGPVVARASDPGCDGAACNTNPAVGPAADTPRTPVRCPGLGGSYVSGARQIGPTCPETVPPEERAFVCPSDQDRADIPRLDFIAEAEGCGATVWQPDP